MKEKFKLAAIFMLFYSFNSISYGGDIEDHLLHETKMANEVSRKFQEEKSFHQEDAFKENIYQRCNMFKGQDLQVCYNQIDKMIEKNPNLKKQYANSKRPNIVTDKQKEDFSSCTKDYAQMIVCEEGRYKYIGGKTGEKIQDSLKRGSKNQSPSSDTNTEVGSKTSSK